MVACLRKMKVETVGPVIMVSLHKKYYYLIAYFLGKCDQIHRKLRICSNLLKKSLMENFIFCAVTSDVNLSRALDIPKVLGRI